MSEKEPTIDELIVKVQALEKRIKYLLFERYSAKIVIVIVLYAATALGLWCLSAQVVGRFSLNKAQAVVIVAIVLGWCGLVAVVMFALAERENTWR